MLICLAWLYNSMSLRKFLLKLPLAGNEAVLLRSWVPMPILQESFFGKWFSFFCLFAPEKVQP